MCSRPDCWVSISEPDSPDPPVQRLTPSPAPPSAVAVETLRGVPVGTEVSLLLVDGTMVDGQYEEVADGFVRIDHPTAPVPLQAIFDVLVRV